VDHSAKLVVELGVVFVAMDQYEWGDQAVHMDGA
jgi:hypothetical protein